MTTTTIPEPTRQPGWRRDAIYSDGVLIGYLDRHWTPATAGKPGSVRWLPCTARWDAVGDREVGFPDRQAAIDALVEATRGGAASP